MVASSHGSLLHHSNPPLTAVDSYWEGQKVMGHTGHALGILSPGSPKDLHHQGFLGVSMEVAMKAWNNMEELDLLPPFSQFHHYICALTFLHTYPTNNVSCGRVVNVTL
jgi:hypothetical protein